MKAINIFSVIETYSDGFDGYTVNRFFESLPDALDAVRDNHDLDGFFNTARIFAVKDENGELIPDRHWEISDGTWEGVCSDDSPYEDGAVGGLEPDDSGIPGRVTIWEEEEDTDLFLLEIQNVQEYDGVIYSEWHLYHGAGAAFAYMVDTINGTVLYRAKINEEGGLVPGEKVVEGWQLESLEPAAEEPELYRLTDVTETIYTTLDGYGGFQDDWGWVNHAWAERGIVALSLPEDGWMHPENSNFWMHKHYELGDPIPGSYEIKQGGRTLFYLERVEQF